MSNILSKIVDQRKGDVAAAKLHTPLALIRKMAEDSPTPKHPLLPAIKQEPKGLVHLIAEVKKASPSKGLLCPDFDPMYIANEYYKAGATALSVLTEPHYFLGSPEYLQEIAAKIPLPILRKDFINDIYQIYEARLWGAGAFLLIVASCEEAFLREAIQLGNELGLTPLVEVHNEPELEIALRINSPIIGINNRNLATFEVSLQTTYDLIKQIPASIPVVSESGIFTNADVSIIKQCGAKAVLVGESLVRDSKNIIANVSALIGLNNNDSKLNK